MRNVPTTILLIGLTLAFMRVDAHAAVSPDDGYAPDGTYQWHFELTPYAWVPATRVHIELGNGARAMGSGADAGASATINAGIPSVSQIRDVVSGVFMGYGLARYGPWSAELDIDYLSVSQTMALPPGPLGMIGRSLHVSTSFVRVAPGFGYEVYRGTLASVPTTLDARAGFSYFTDDTTLGLTRFGPRGNRLLVSTLDHSDAFVQPWLGFRLSFYPGPRWRLQLLASMQGLGVDGGVWGWGAGAFVTWAATHWLNLTAGFNALSSRGRGESGAVVRSIDFTEYGPLIGMSFTF